VPCWRILAMAGALGWAGTASAVDVGATLKGTVYDTDGIEFPHAEVSISSPSYLGGSNQLTDDEGRYQFVALPPGEYVVHVEAPSFKPFESAPITVQLNATVRLDVTIVGSDKSDVITVEAKAPVIDVQKTQTGQTMSAEFLRDLPTARDYQSAIALAPGMVGTDHAQGGFDSSNQYYIDGVNTTDPVTNTFSANMNYDAIDSIEVITGAMDAEYGKAMGGAFNIVTKSGGNQFHGDAFLTYADQNFVIAPTLAGDSTDKYFNQSLSLNLGGPIIKDKIWFYSSIEGDRYVNALSIDPEVPRDLSRFPLIPRDYHSIYLFGKITAAPSSENRIAVQAQGDPTVINNTEQSPWTLPSGETEQDQGGYILTATHTFTPSSKSLLTTQVYFEKSVINYHSILWKQCKNYDEFGACTDDFSDTEYMGETVGHGFFGYSGNDFSSGEFPYAEITQRYRASVSSSFQQFFDLLGEHKAKVGIEADLMKSHDVWPGLENGYEYWTAPQAPDGTIDYNDIADYTPVQKYQYVSNLETKQTGTTLSAYVEDVWNPIKRLTLRPGVRLDIPALKNDVGDTVLKVTTISPRFGGAFDVTGDGKTAIHAYYGRFYDNGFLGVASILDKKSQASGQYSWDPHNNDWSTTPDYTTSSTFLQSPDLRNPYMDQYNAGISHQIGDAWALDATLVYKYAHRFWEDDEVNSIWNADGTDVIGYRNGVAEQMYRLRTPDDTYTRYTSFELKANHQFTKDFEMLVSYTYSRAYGTNSGDQATGVHDITQQYQYEIGLLDYDTPHAVKMSGSYDKDDVLTIGRLHAGYSLGFNQDIESGSLYRPIVWNDYYGSYNNYESVSDGRYRLPMYADTDVRADLSFGVAGSDPDSEIATWGLGADIYNVFNDRTITSVNTEFGPAGDGTMGDFGAVTSRQDRRNFAINVHGEF